MLTRPAIALTMAGLIAAALVPVTSQSAMADGAMGGVTCQKGKDPKCTATAGSSSTNNHTESTGGSGGCRNALGNPAPCTDPNLGWMGSDGCYYATVEGDTDRLEELEPTPTGPGGWYLQTCPGGGSGTQLGGIVWVPGAAPVPPVVVARRAASQLRLSSPRIGSSPSPGTAQLVSLPTWLWIDRTGWGARSATATVPGVSVTATATPTKVTWSLGDGATVVCHGPGTVFPTGGDPKASSPDCGHTYTRSSAGQPGGAFTVTATITWAISWTGAGQGGTLPAMTTRADARFTVAESQALVVAGGLS